MNRASTLLSALLLSSCLTSMPNTASSPAPEPEASSTQEGSKSGDGEKAAVEKPTRKPLQRVVGYFADWTYNRKGDCKFTVEDIDPMMFTHLNFAFARVDGGERKSPTFKLATFDNTDSGPTGQYARFVALKKKNPNLKTMLSVGGWTHSDPPHDWIFSAMAEKPEYRKQFIDSAIKYLRDYGFDGLDLDWEYPSEPTRGGRAMDSGNYIKLLKETRAAFEAEASASGKERLLLTIAAPSGVYMKWYDLKKVQAPLDWINLMSYDYGGAWDKRATHNAPNPAVGPGVAASVSVYKNFGVPADKIVVGLATYGHTFGGVSDSKPGTPATATAPKQRCTQEPGLVAFFEMQELIASGRAKAEWDDANKVPYAYDEKAQAWFSYDNEKSFNQKLDFIEEQGLGGAMIWEIDTDDFHKGFPLISLASKRLPK